MKGNKASLTVAGCVREGDIDVHVDMLALVRVHGNERVFGYLGLQEVIHLVAEKKYDSL